MSTPTYQRAFFRIIVYIIIAGHLYRQAFIEIATVFRVQCQRRIFGVSRDKEFTTAPCHCHIDTGIFRFGKQRQFRNFQNVFPAYFCMTAMRHIETIIKTTEDGVERFQYPMFKDTEHLLFQRIFRNPIMMIQSGLRSPAYI